MLKIYRFFKPKWAVKISKCGRHLLKTSKNCIMYRICFKLSYHLMSIACNRKVGSYLIGLVLIVYFCCPYLHIKSTFDFFLNNFFNSIPHDKNPRCAHNTSTGWKDMQRTYLGYLMPPGIACNGENCFVVHSQWISTTWSCIGDSSLRFCITWYFQEGTIGKAILGILEWK